MTRTEQRMTPAQMASLLDAALAHAHPLTFFDMVVVTFKTIGRHADGVSVAWMSILNAEGEMDVFMGLRAAWRRGGAAHRKARI